MNKMKSKKAEMAWWTTKMVYILASLLAILLIVWLLKGLMGEILLKIMGGA